MRKKSFFNSRILQEWKQHVYVVLVFIAILALLVIFQCKPRGRYGRQAYKQEKSYTMEFKGIESTKNPVYALRIGDKVLQLPMETTDKGKLVSVILNGTKTGFELSEKQTGFTVSPQGILTWHDEGLLTVEEIGGEETLRKLHENNIGDSLNIRLHNVRIGNCVLSEVNVKVVQGQEFPYRMGLKVWEMLLLSSPSPQE